MGPHSPVDVCGFTMFRWCRSIPYGFSDLRKRPKTPLLDSDGHIRDDTRSYLPQSQNPKISTDQPGHSRTYIYQWSFMGPHSPEDVCGFTIFRWCRSIPYGFSDLHRHPKTPLFISEDHVRIDTHRFHVTTSKSEEIDEV